MGNMSYCRFENTLSDLRDCDFDWELDPHEDRSEYSARKQMIEMCVDIALNYGHEVGQAVILASDCEA